MKQLTLVIITLLFACWGLNAQDKATISGKVTNEKNEPLEFVAVGVPALGIGTETDEKGKYTLNVPANRNITIEYSYTGYELTPRNGYFSSGEKKTINVILKQKAVDIEKVEVTAEREEDFVENVESIPVKEIEMMVNPSQNLDISRIAVGVTGSADELSSQYSVRGGSYDENLVYVNDFEIYRPFLVRSGRQEGLTFPNTDLIRSISFSSGGFQAKYGDKLSSVLDVKYKRPDSVRASIGLSLLGGSTHVEGSIKKKKKDNQKFTYLFGARYKTTKYILGSLETTGEYTPNFLDIQSYLSYDLSETWQLGLIGNVNRSVYEFVPNSRSTTLGLVNLALRFDVFFEGQEVDDFNTYMGGISLSHLPKDKNYYFKWLASSYQSRENERIDILGFYRLGVLETDLGDEDAGEVIATIGAGLQHNYVRNFLTTNVTNGEFKGGWEKTKEDSTRYRFKSNHIRYGLKYQHEDIFDRINEWERLDSAGYSLPYSSTGVNLWETLKTNIDLQSNRYSGYFQNTWKVTKDTTREIGITAGVRASYWDLNEEWVITPRFQFYYKPLARKKDFLFKASVGMYYQPPFYRELRSLDGTINKGLLSQKSIHSVLGLAYDFEMWGRDFRFITEAYYKHLFDLVAYDVDNVRIRYYGNNNASGYAAGVDVRINGEFAEGLESWINFSLLRTRESFDGIDHMRREVGDSTGVVVNDVPRPTDQLASVSIFFQDYLPKMERFKVNLNLVVGTGLPFGIPRDNEVYRNTYRYSPYYRADIGFSYMLWDAMSNKRKASNPFRNFRKAWLSFEVFNLLQVANAASNTWVKTVGNQFFAVPNYLTSRRINLRFKINF